MKRSEPLWKRKRAREHCAWQRDKVWRELSGTGGWSHTFIMGKLTPSDTDDNISMRSFGYTVSDLDKAANYTHTWFVQYNPEKKH